MATSFEYFDTICRPTPSSIADQIEIMLDARIADGFLKLVYLETNLPDEVEHILNQRYTKEGWGGVEVMSLRQQIGYFIRVIEPVRKG